MKRTQLPIKYFIKRLVDAQYTDKNFVANLSAIAAPVRNVFATGCGITEASPSVMQCVAPGISYV